jgi:2-oxoglutarate dehydrogenase E1 component
MNFDASGLDATNLPLLEEIYQRYEQNPMHVDSAWRNYFQNLEKQKEGTAVPLPKLSGVLSEHEANCQVCNLIKAYRTFGHLMAKINPIARQEPEMPSQLKIENYGFSETDLQKEFPTCGLIKKEKASLQEILNTLQKIYSNRIGVEYMDFVNPEMERWIQEQIEPSLFHINLSIDQKQTLLQYLNKSELFEVFLHTKFPGQKRFSLEGGETLIPILEAIIETAANLGGEEFIIGMAHRGRLNVLSNILKKSHVLIFTEFDENFTPESFEGSGDVKYHKGFYSESLTIHDHKVNIVLVPNPSHLEAVNPVVEGESKAKQIQQHNDQTVIPLLIHGDAAISGQGIIYETLQLSKLNGYATGGTIHVVINNQIGFTTVPKDSRSTLYCTDIAKSFGAPIFHVNSEDPEGCFNAAILAAEFRQKFHTDVFIDLNCYRKYGHNETDEPAFTQPLEYKIIREKKPVRETYRDELINQGVLEKQMAETLEVEFKKDLQEALSETKAKIEKDLASKKEEIYLPGTKEENPFQLVDTAVSLQVLEEIAQKVCTIPPEFTLHPKLANLMKERLEMVKKGPDAKPLDWGMAETLAYGSILWEGKNVRVSGQDSCRGTFSHRHGLWVDQKEEKDYFPLQHLKEGQGRFDLINSPLSEYAALGFEYGYSLPSPQTLVIWEAQYGDFSNGAQVIIDQFISTAEQKWGQKSALTLFLPHGFEAQGPEHSSARIERFLTLAGNNNMFIVNPTAPAQLFHLLRRQVMRSNQKPLIVFTPKALLRHPDFVSPLVDLTRGSFQEILDDPAMPKKAKRIAFCSGRIFYDLNTMRTKTKTDDLALIRIEQLYPLDIEKIKAIIKNYPSAEEFFWVQEEPMNMGAWNFISRQLAELIPTSAKLTYVGRPRSASPAAGSIALHKKENAAIMDALFIKQ